MPANSAEIQLKVVTCQIFHENCYICHREDAPDCLIIDPGLESQAVVDYVQQQDWRPAAILNTHGHVDHIAGNGLLKRTWPDAPIVIGRGDAEKLTDSLLNLSLPFGMEITSPPADRLLEEGDTFEAAGFHFEVLETPGHSSGHIVLIEKSPSPWIVFGGDVLFAGSVGRTDFPDGDMDQLLASIRDKLFPLPETTRILPGHGPETTIGEERRTNPFL